MNNTKHTVKTTFFRRVHTAVAMLALTSLTATAQITIEIDPADEGRKMSKPRFGITITDDTEHFSADLVRNGDFVFDADQLKHWREFLSVTGNADLKISTDAPRGYTRSLHVKTSNIGDTDGGVQTAPYMSIFSNAEYKFTAWVKANRANTFYIMLKGEYGQKLTAAEIVNLRGGKGSWQRIEVKLSPSASLRKGVLAISTKGNADFLITGVSLERVGNKSDFRDDVVEVLRDFKPEFISTTGLSKTDLPKAERLSTAINAPLDNVNPAKSFGSDTYGAALQWAESVVKAENVGVSSGSIATPMSDLLLTDGFATPTPLYYMQKAVMGNSGTRALPVVVPTEEEGSPSQLFTPERSHIGLSTTDASATFVDLTVLAEGQEIYASGRRKGEYNITDGEGWEITRSGLRQTSAEGSTAVFATQAIASRKYSVQVRTKKTAGDGGVKVLFNYADGENFCALNIGNGIELVQTTAGQTSVIGQLTTQIENDKWYDLRIEVDGNSIATFLADRPLLRAKLGAPAGEGISYSASIDEETGELIMKIVNTGRISDYARLNFHGYEVQSAVFTEVFASYPSVRNTAGEKSKVTLQTMDLTMDAKYPRFIIDPYSVNVLRIKLRK